MDNNEKLSQIIADIERMLGKPISESRNEVKHLTDWGLTLSEAEAWREHEPDFTRRIFTALDTRRRGNRTCMQVLISCRGFGAPLCW